MFSLFFYCAEETKYTVKIKADVIAKQQITVAFAHTQKNMFLCQRGRNMLRIKNQCHFRFAFLYC
jgi:hypothetical protein